MKTIVYIWPYIDIYAIKLLCRYAFLYFTCIIRTPATGRLFVVKTARIVTKFLRVRSVNIDLNKVLIEQMLLTRLC